MNRGLSDTPPSTPGTQPRFACRDSIGSNFHLIEGRLLLLLNRTEIGESIVRLTIIPDDSFEVGDGQSNRSFRPQELIGIDDQTADNSFEGNQLVTRQTGRQFDNSVQAQPLNDRDGARTIATLTPPGFPGDRWYR